jgi:poly-D-alanine transfer protein DltD
VDEKISRYKTMIASKGFQQVHDIDYDDTFSLVTNMDSIHLALDIAATKGWEVHHMDVKNEFIHSDLSKEIYMEHPQGFM